MKKTLWVTFGMVIALTCVVIFFLFISLDTLVTMAVEKYGSEVLQTEVRLNQTDISVRSGRGTLSGLRVRNPEGFETENAVELDTVEVTLDIGSLRQDTVVINEIQIQAPQVTYEIGPQGSNLEVLQKHLAESTGEGTRADSKSGSNESAGPEGKKFIIENIHIKDGKVNVSTVGLQGQKMSVGLPSVHLSGIGQDSGGATPAEVAKKIIDAINSVSGDAVRTLDLGKVLQQVEGEAGDAAKKVIDRGAKDVEKALGEAGKDIGSAVEGLLGK